MLFGSLDQALRLPHVVITGHVANNLRLTCVVERRPKQPDNVLCQAYKPTIEWSLAVLSLAFACRQADVRFRDTMPRHDTVPRQSGGRLNDLMGQGWTFVLARQKNGSVKLTLIDPRGHRHICRSNGVINVLAKANRLFRSWT